MLAKIRNTFTYKYLTFCGISTILSATILTIHTYTYNSHMWFKELYVIIMQVIIVGLLSLITIIPIIIDIIRRNKLAPRKPHGFIVIGLEFITISIFLVQSYFVLFFIVPNLF